MPDGSVCRQDTNVLHKDQTLARITRKVPADEGVATAEHERETPSPVEKSANTGIEQTFDQHVYGFTVATEASFEHGESSLHAEDEKRTQQAPMRCSAD